jgi:hypothetical protein
MPGWLCLLCLAQPTTAGPLDELQPGHWYEVPNSKLETVFPNPPPRGNTGPSSVMDAWSGGAYDTRRDRLIIWGGGHLDYSGNEIYVFDLKDLRWRRLDEPTKVIKEDVARYPDGRPSSRHTYNYVQYAPNIDRFFSLGFAAAYGGPAISGDAVDAYDFDALRWDTKADKPANGITTGAISAYDPTTGKLWHHGCLDDGSLVAYDPIADSWSRPLGNHALAYYATAAIDPARRIMVATGGAENNYVLVWSLERPGSPSMIRTSGPKILESAHAPGFVYDPVSTMFVGWSGGAHVYTLDPDTWAWTRVDPAPGNTVTPTEPNETGTYGRFQYVPNLNAFILVNRPGENVYFYRLSGGGSKGGATSPPRVGSGPIWRVP